MQPAKELEEKKYVGLMVYFCITMPFTSIILDWFCVMPKYLHLDITTVLMLHLSVCL